MRYARRFFPSHGRTERKALVKRNSSRDSKPHLVICGRAVGRRHRLIIQPQIDSELGAMMDQVIQKHFPVSEKWWSFENGFALKTELPVFLPSVIWHCLESGANLGRAFVEGFHQLSGRLERQRCEAALGKVELGRGQHRQTEAGKPRHGG